MSLFVLSNGTTVNTNLSGIDYAKLESGEWKLGWVADNVGLDDETNDTFYETRKDGMGENTIRCFKDKLQLKMEDGTTFLAHIIHWVPGEVGGTPGFFCATTSTL